MHQKQPPAKVASRLPARRRASAALLSAGERRGERERGRAEQRDQLAPHHALSAGTKVIATPFMQ